MYCTFPIKIHETISFYWLKSLDTQLNESTNQNSLKSPKLLSQRTRLKTLRTSLETAHCPLYSWVSVDLYHQIGWIIKF